MLVLSRKKDESIVLADNIEIIVTDISRNRVRLGIRAPKDVSIHRKEIYEKIKEVKIDPSTLNDAD